MKQHNKKSSLRGSQQADAVIHKKTRLLHFVRNDDSAENECGNALWFILVAIGLLGLLTVMMSRSSSTSNETGDYEQNVIVANEILSYAKNLENGVQSLLARGCSENEISFENAVVAGYSNPNSPTDKSCHVFDVNGAGMTWDKLPENALDTTLVGNPQYGDAFYFRSGAVKGLGTDCVESRCNELIMTFPYLKENIAKAFNKIVNFSVINPPSHSLCDLDYFPSRFFNGIFYKHPSCDNNQYGGSFRPDSQGKESGCIRRTDFATFASATYYECYHVLYAR